MIDEILSPGIEYLNEIVCLPDETFTPRSAFEILIMFPNCSLESRSLQQCMKMTDFLWSPQKSIRKHLYRSEKSKFGIYKV